MMPSTDQGARGKAGSLVRLFIVLLVAVVPLGSLAYYLMQYEYTVSSSPAEPVRRAVGNELAGLKAEVIVPPASRSAVLCWFELLNEGPRKIRLVDCVRAGKALSVSVSFLGESGAGPCKALAVRPGVGDALRGGEDFSEIEDGLVDLLPGSVWRKPLELSRFYDLDRPGVYEVAVSYDSRRMASGHADLKSLGANEGFVAAAPARFRVAASPRPKPEAE